MSKKIEVDTWVICPECKTKVKQKNLLQHMKHIHNKKIEDNEKKSKQTMYKKRQENKTLNIISKTTIGIITIIFIILIISVCIYFLSDFKDSNNQNYLNGSNYQNYSKDSNNQNENKSYFVSIQGKGNYSSIQEAIDSASNNDIIFVKNGTYFENIKITKSLELIGENKNTTILNGNGSGTVIHISTDNIKISGFTIINGGPLSQNKDAGIKIASNYNKISNCNFYSNSNYGLYLGENTKNNIIKNNTFSSNSYGLYAYYAKTNNISSNTFTRNVVYGIYLLDESDDNLISDNIFTDNDYAIRIKGSTHNTVINNLIMSNNHGLYFCCGAKNNKAYNNFFINNTNWNANDALVNEWDNGITGNYWADYTGTDANGDGIGDIPYIINDDNADRFPLMQPK